MANRRNSIKKIRADETKRVRNRRVLSEVRTTERRLNDACAAQDTEKATQLTKLFFSKVDKALKRGILKENTAGRAKSRASRRVKSLAKS